LSRLAALVLLLAGCTSTRDGPGDGVRLVPWDAVGPAAGPPATAGPSSPAGPAPPCPASSLEVVGGGFRFTTAASGGTGQLTLLNAGHTACRLTGRPEVRIVGATPQPQQRQVDLPASPAPFPTAVPPDSTLLALPTGAAVTLDVDWRNWCVAPSATTPVPPRAVRLTLPDGAGSIDVDYNAVPPCENPASASTVGVRPFQPAPLPATPPWTSTVTQARIEPLSGGTGPLTGRRGETVGFSVLLLNPSSTPVSFERCPLVIQMLAPAGQPEVHPLNCRAAGELPAGGSLRFEMRIQIPVSAPAGDNGLFWQLDPTGAHGPEASSRITVTAQ
jgi:hypothetical protein